MSKVFNLLKIADVVAEEQFAKMVHDDPTDVGDVEVVEPISEGVHKDRTERKMSSNHKNFDSKKEALAFLKKNALMSVGWSEGGKEKVAIYWNGRLHTEDAKTKKIWGSEGIDKQRVAIDLAKSMTAATGIRDRLDAAERMAKNGGRGLELARREIEQVARDTQALSKEIWKIMNDIGRGSDAAGFAAEEAVREAIRRAL